MSDLRERLMALAEQARKLYDAHEESCRAMTPGDPACDMAECLYRLSRDVPAAIRAMREGIA